MKAYKTKVQMAKKSLKFQFLLTLVEQAKEYRQILIGKLADVETASAEKFLMEEEPTVEEMRAAMRKGVISLKLVPVFCGSAFKNKNVQHYFLMR
jgi:elongation factor G